MIINEPYQVLDFGDCGSCCYIGTQQQCSDWIEQNQQLLSDGDVQFMMNEYIPEDDEYIDDELGIVKINEDN